MLSNDERAYIRDLAKQIREIANSPRQADIVRRYKNINSLKVARPPVSVFAPADAHKKLYEIKTPAIDDADFKGLENEFVTLITKNRLSNTDMPITNVFYTGLFKSVTDWMDGYVTVRARPDGTSVAFEPCIKQYSDLKKMRRPELTVDWPRTRQHYEQVNDVLGDILDIRIGSPFSMTCGWGESMIDQLVEMRGLEQVYYDLVDAPEFVHEAMQLMTDGKLALLNQYYEQGALIANNDRYPIGSCSYPLTDELPGSNPARPITEKNLWAFAQAQEFQGISADMLEEFVLPYQARIVNRFGLASYGCCEALDNKIDAISRNIANLRILAISPYTNVGYASEKCRNRFVMSCKIHPDLASHFSVQRTEEYLRNLILETKGCCMTIAFAEIMDYGKDEGVLLQLADIAQNMLDQYWQPE